MTIVSEENRQRRGVAERPNGADADPGVRESRDPEEAWVPTRSSLPAAGPVFSHGFWRRMRAGPGCFLSLFVIVGSALFSWGLVWTLTGWALESEQAEPAFFKGAMAFGAVFVLVALACLRITLTQQANRERKGSVRGDPRKPWTWDHPWHPKGMRPDYSGHAAGNAFGRVAILSLFALFNIALVDSPWFFKLIIAAIDAFGLLILYDSLTKLLQAARFRPALVTWPTFPALLGGTLEATIRPGTPLRPTGPVEVTLRCVKDTWVEETSRGRTSRILRPVSAYRATRTLRAPILLTRLDVAFDVPRDLPGTDLASETAVYWQVLLRVPLVGPDFEVIFLAPVYEAGDLSGHHLTGSSNEPR